MSSDVEAMLLSEVCRLEEELSRTELFRWNWEQTAKHRTAERDALKARVKELEAADECSLDGAPHCRAEDPCRACQLTVAWAKVKELEAALRDLVRHLEGTSWEADEALDASGALAVLKGGGG